MSRVDVGTVFLHVQEERRHFVSRGKKKVYIVCILTITVIPTLYMIFFGTKFKEFTPPFGPKKKTISDLNMCFLS